MAGKREDGGDEILGRYEKRIDEALARAREEREKVKARKRELLGLEPMTQVPGVGSLSINWNRNVMAPSLIEQCTTVYTTFTATNTVGANYVQWPQSQVQSQAAQQQMPQHGQYYGGALGGGFSNSFPTGIYPSGFERLWNDADTQEERDRLFSFSDRPVIGDAQHAVPSWRDWEE